MTEKQIFAHDVVKIMAYLKGKCKTKDCNECKKADLCYNILYRRISLIDINALEKMLIKESRNE